MAEGSEPCTTGTPGLSPPGLPGQGDGGLGSAITSRGDSSRGEEGERSPMSSKGSKAGGGLLMETRLEGLRAPGLLIGLSRGSTRKPGLLRAGLEGTRET